jgi:hypothetical protein
MFGWSGVTGPLPISAHSIGIEGSDKFVFNIPQSDGADVYANGTQVFGSLLWLSNVGDHP